MAKITEDYVSFETAKLLKEKGFKEECEYFYDEYENEDEYVICSNGGTCNDDGHPTYYSMPTLQMAMKWLRENHYLYIDIELLSGPSFLWYIWLMNDPQCLKGCSTNLLTHFYDTYEQATEAAIKYCLENLI